MRHADFPIKKQGSEDRIRPARREEWQPFTASDQTSAVTENLMERICDRENLNQAFRKVQANKGGAGIDGMTVDDLFAELVAHRETLLLPLRG